MAGKQCPFCGQVMTITPDNHSVTYASFDHHGNTQAYTKTIDCASSGGTFTKDVQKVHDVGLFFYVCPECEKTSIHLKSISSDLPALELPIYPPASTMVLPDYIPSQIVEDYKEACSILYLSPKASATLSRRCLQGMLRDFWKTNERTLAKEIDSIKDEVQPDVWRSIDSIRSIGNIGAHMEKDVNTIIDVTVDVAKVLIRMLEYLFKEWYINHHERQEMHRMLLDATEQIDRKKGWDHP